jgi:hypothetical protein
VGTVPTHVDIYWPYWIFLGGVVVGIVPYYAGQERSRPAEHDVVDQLVK